MSSREQRRERSTCCDYCTYPFQRSEPIAVSAAPFVNKTDFIVEGYGSVPVTNGDPKWLPTRVKAFIAAQIIMMRPAEIYICNGSWSEAEYLVNSLERKGMLERLTAYENVFVARTDPRDAMERGTYVTTNDPDSFKRKKRSHTGFAFARWMSHSQSQSEIYTRFTGCMRGRVM
ncbi:hypothetical protein DICVIV_11647 [Dictyocaulus viviparus]|uniref:Phosphoenolpyruvate carboxykinase GTP-utilising N-terminal domain-containing protein n=1 Tax=Dictyocaulus viviparus TaxID=29172 RepID=A0A0D8XCL8_DICVI|nr:hypothetical protein DICVIV_11647 [Dictyocaulus viviparus]